MCSPGFETALVQMCGSTEVHHSELGTFSAKLLYNGTYRVGTTMRDEGLPHYSTNYQELYERLFDHFLEKSNIQHFYHILFLAAVVQCLAVDTSICEHGFSLMNMLKNARMCLILDELLRYLMTICSLAPEWEDPRKIPVDDIIVEWRAQSKRGRYNEHKWSAQEAVD